MTSYNHRSNFRSSDVPVVFQQTHHFGNYPATDYENFSVVVDPCQQLDFTLHNEVQQSSTEEDDTKHLSIYDNEAKS